MFTAILSLTTVLALLSRRAFPYTFVLLVGWIGTALLQYHDLWTWMPVLDALGFWALLIVWHYFPLKRGLACIALSAITLVVHTAYYWPQPIGVYYGVEYMYALQGLFLISMAFLALGDFDARSFVGSVLEGARRFPGRASGPRVAHRKAVESEE